jgi:hypothetical protein
MLLYLIADASVQTDPIGGFYGWAGAGLLGLVLAWLLGKRLPAEAEERRVLLDNKDAQITAILKDKDAQLKEQRVEFLETLVKITAQFQAELLAERQSRDRWIEFLRKRAEANEKAKGLNDL